MQRPILCFRSVILIVKRGSCLFIYYYQQADYYDSICTVGWQTLSLLPSNWSTNPAISPECWKYYVRTHYWSNTDNILIEENQNKSGKVRITADRPYKNCCKVEQTCLNIEHNLSDIVFRCNLMLCHPRTLRVPSEILRQQLVKFTS